MKPFNPKRSILIHGQEGSSQGDKAVLLRAIFPEMLIPDFRGELQERMTALLSYLDEGDDWTVIGSSLGGLMAAIFSTSYPKRVRKQILLAPALFLPEFAGHLPEPIDVPTVIYHGRDDVVVPLGATRALAEKAFKTLEFHEVNDDHRLFDTTQNLDWKKIVE